MFFANVPLATNSSLSLKTIKKLAPGDAWAPLLVFDCYLSRHPLFWLLKCRLIYFRNKRMTPLRRIRQLQLYPFCVLHHDIHAWIAIFSFSEGREVPARNSVRHAVVAWFLRMITNATLLLLLSQKWLKHKWPFHLHTWQACDAKRGKKFLEFLSSK